MIKKNIYTWHRTIGIITILPDWAGKNIRDGLMTLSALGVLTVSILGLLLFIRIRK